MHSPNEFSVIVIDDHELSLIALSEFLSGLGRLRVDRAASCVQALELLARADDTDLIVLDIYLPDMDGIEFMRKLNETHFVGGLILVSGDPYILNMSRNFAVTVGLDVWGALVKPVVPSVLAKLVNDNLPPERSVVS